MDVVQDDWLISDYWRLCDELSIVQAALLLSGCDPSGESGYVENWTMHQRPSGYEASMLHPRFTKPGSIANVRIEIQIVDTHESLETRFNIGF